jgi:hypothetical protein
VTSILIDHETDCVGKIISLSFHASIECLNQRLDMSRTSMLRRDGLELQVGFVIKLKNSEFDWNGASVAVQRVSLDIAIHVTRRWR